jgi:flagellar biosynthesis/type III secretory pathway M-ring protein FliF/YscJ
LIDTNGIVRVVMLNITHVKVIVIVVLFFLELFAWTATKTHRKQARRRRKTERRKQEEEEEEEEKQKERKDPFWEASIRGEQKHQNNPIGTLIKRINESNCEQLNFIWRISKQLFCSLCYRFFVYFRAY